MGDGAVVAATSLGHERGGVTGSDRSGEAATASWPDPSGDARAGALALTYVLPLRARTPASADLAAYLGALLDWVDDVVVVDGSAEPVRQAHARAWPDGVRHLRVDPALAYANGKVNGVLTGLASARHDKVVVADDDVRYDRAGLAAVARLLDVAHAIMPQNYYGPLTWPAVYDTARVLVQRAFGPDFAGTVGARRHLLACTCGYDGDVLFENLELMRTVSAAGGIARYEPGVYVRRLPPGPRHLLGQRVRQAYDELARPAHLAAALAVAPAVASLVAGKRWTLLGASAAACVLVAERGRRRLGGGAYLPVGASLLAPVWVLERGVCVWVALCWWLVGGVPYAGRRLRRAANSPRRLRALHARTAAALLESAADPLCTVNG